ncbi:hypothetical protein V8B97DRAFT_1959766 [Scleroderma yunnanense]
MTASVTHGMPLLSGPPPPPSPPDADACRKCGKEFSVFFNRQRKCMHCGYAYCSSCTDYQALMPRNGPVRGYDLAHVCAFCIELLNVTALGKNQLRSLSLAKLRRYVDAYNLSIKGAIDKNDIVDVMVAARTAQGCLPVANEAYYRKHAVPKYSSIPGSSSNQSATSRTRYFFSRAASGDPQTPSSSPSSSFPGSHSRPYSAASSFGANSRAQAFPRPDLHPRHDQAPETSYGTYVPQSSGSRSRTTSGPSSSGAARSINNQWPRSPPAQSRTSSFSRPSNTTSERPAHPPPAPAPAAVTAPPLAMLLVQPRSSIAALSVGALKKVLFEARVRIPPGVCEKEDLVERVWAFLEEERRKETENDHSNDWEEYYDDDGIVVAAEEEDAMEGNTNDYSNFNDFFTVPPDDDHLSAPNLGGYASSRPATPQPRAASTSQDHSQSHIPTTPKGKARPAKPTEVDRAGLCVICQDDEANIAIVDCGHLAMCRGCSDLVMESSRECPLCRTRIVTEARLLRIFKT